jgi:hypothetical protein
VRAERPPSNSSSYYRLGRMHWRPGRWNGVRDFHLEPWKLPANPLPRPRLEVDDLNHLWDSQALLRGRCCLGCLAIHCRREGNRRSGSGCAPLARGRYDALTVGNAMRHGWWRKLLFGWRKGGGNRASSIGFPHEIRPLRSGDRTP